MTYISYYNSIISKITLAADEQGLIGLWLDEGKNSYKYLRNGAEEKDVPVLKRTKLWLDIYFSGKNPEFTPPLHISGSNFQISVWKILTRIPYGKTVSYGEIAKIIAAERGIKRMAAQAVGGAVGRNKISIIIPCHRVIGTNGSLTGYGSGIDKKLALLKLEKAI